MGDAADDLTEQEMDFWIDHLLGHPINDGPCSYCEDEGDEDD